MQLSRKVTPSNQMSDKEYRELKDRLSYSAFKQYVNSRSKFYKEMILGEYVKRVSTEATIKGDMVHVLLADQQGEWDSKFVMASGKIPTGQMQTLVLELYNRSLRSMDAEGRQVDQFSVILQDAINVVKYEADGITEKAFKKKTNEWILEAFQKEGESYYQELLKSTGKDVITMIQVETAEKLVTQLREHPYTRDIVNLQSTEEVEVFTELVILYQIDNIKYRSMVDKLVVDHKNKTVTPWDYKTTWSPESGWEYSYLSNYYYIQVGLYDLALKEWIKEHGLQDYKVLPMRYICIDTTGQASPVIYVMQDKDVLLAQRGFTVRGRKYMGINEIQKNIAWHLSSGDWTTTEIINKNNGQMMMDIVYR